MDLVIVLVTPFVGHPIRCAIVAALFSGAVFLPAARRGERIALAAAALLWWGWAALEAAMPGDAIRMDLLLIAPLMIAVTGIGAWLCLRVLERAGFRPELGPKDKT